MAIQSSTLRPGLLVSLKTSVVGNVSYNKRYISPEHETEDGRNISVWETERVITDAAEHEAAKVARGKASSLIRRICSASAFGLLCPEANAAELEAAIKDARKVCEAFNATATLSRVSVYVITGRVAADDVEAVKAINSEVRDLLATMHDGIANADVEVIRGAATKARGLGQMLSPDAQSRIQIAIEAVRGAARDIVKAGEAAAVEVDQRVLRQLTECRTAFLDLDNGDAEVAAPAAQARTLDLAPEAPESDVDALYRELTAKPQLEIE